MGVVSSFEAREVAACMPNTTLSCYELGAYRSVQVIATRAPSPRSARGARSPALDSPAIATICNEITCAKSAREHNSNSAPTLWGFRMEDAAVFLSLGEIGSRARPFALGCAVARCLFRSRVHRRASKRRPALGGTQANLVQTRRPPRAKTAGLLAFYADRRPDLTPIRIERRLLFRADEVDPRPSAATENPGA